MNIELTDGFFITCDSLNYELHDGSVTYYKRTLIEVLEKYLEIIRKDRTRKFDGGIEEYAEAIKQSNNKIITELMMVLESKGVK